MAAQQVDPRVPSHAQLKSFYFDSERTLFQEMKTKLREANRMKSTALDPHSRTVTIPQRHRLVFSGCFASKFVHTERNLNGVNLRNSSPIFEFSVMNRVIDIFDSHPVVKCHKSGDITMITPWCVFTNNINNADDTEEGLPHSFLTTGQLLIPIASSMNNELLCFVPCAGFDPDTNQVPEWVEAVKLKEIVSGLKFDDFEVLKRRGDGKITTLKNTDYTSLKYGQEIIEGDYIVCRGEHKKIYAISEDAFYPEKTRNIVRFTSHFTKNANKQPYDIVAEPMLQGKIVNVPMDYLKLHQPVSIVLEKINNFNLGNLNIRFKNACFNCLGFLTHDTHILI